TLALAHLSFQKH
ncbi:peptidase M9 N-terminal family protein, partial [Vibrio parahaemolyticus V-223/04]